MNIILFKAEPSEHGAFSQSLKRREHTLIEVASLVELKRYAGRLESIAAVVFPFKLFDGSSGIRPCVELRSDPDFVLMPIIGLAPKADQAILSAFAQAGADAVFSSPLDSNLIHFQITALVKRQNAMIDLYSAQIDKVHVDQIIFDGLDKLEQGLIVLNQDLLPVYFSGGAKVLLGAPAISDKWQSEIARALSENIKAEFRRDPYLGQSFPIDLVPLGFRGQTWAKELRGTDGTNRGYAIVLTDTSKMAPLIREALESRRLQNFLCQIGAACAKYFANGQIGGAFPNYDRLENFLADGGKTSSLSAVLRTLLEFLDLILSPQVHVRVATKEDPQLAVAPWDLFRILAHIFLYCESFLDFSGEVLIECQQIDLREGAPIVFIAKGVSRQLPVGQDFGPTLELAESAVRGGAGLNQHALGLEQAQLIAQKYGSTLEYRTEPGKMLKVRVVLPLQNAVSTTR